MNKYSDDISDKEFVRMMRHEFPIMGEWFIGWLDRLDASNEQARLRRECREREVALSSFRACQECTKCGANRFHLMDTSKGIDKHGHVTRECGECGHSWRQK